MKIGLLHYSAPPVVGGVESIIGHHSRLMSNAGHNVQILAGQGSRNDEKVEFVHIPLLGSTQDRILSAKDQLDRGIIPDDFPSLVQDIQESLATYFRDLDVVIAHNVCSLHKNLALTAALHQYSNRESGARLVVWHHDLAWTSERYKNEMHNGYPWNLLRQLWPGVSTVVVSNFRRVELAALTGAPIEKILVIPNGIFMLDFLEIQPRAREIITRLNLLEAAPFLLLPVRMTRRKNIELAIDMVAELIAAFPDTALVITGPPGPHNKSNQEYFALLKNMRNERGLERHVHFLAEFSSEYYPDEVIRGLYRLADVLFLPSMEEGFGLPIIEASQAKLPIFCSDIPSLRELAGDHATYFSPKSRAHDIAEILSRHLSSSNVFQLRKHLRSLEWSAVYKDQIEPLIHKVAKGAL